MNAAQSVTATFTLLPPTGTRIAKAKINRKKHRASFRFTASGTVTGFQCALVGPGHRKLKFASCKSPKTYKHLKHGRYKFEVRAVNSSGPDSKPAIKKFRI
jgi:predicted phage tail protein